MIRHRHSATGLCLVLVLICMLIAKPTRADHGKRDRLFGLRRSSQFAPIGVAFSLGHMVIDGRRLSGEQILWGGQLVAAEESGASAALGDVGRVVFCRGSSARLLTSIAGDPLHRGEPTLDAQVVGGAVVISLQPEAVARVEIGDWVIRSSRGSKFRVGIVAGALWVEVECGKVETEFQQPDVGYILVAAKPREGSRPPVPSNQNHIKAEANKIVPIPVLVTQRPAVSRPRVRNPLVVPVAYQGVPAGHPASGIEIEFCLGNPAIGSINKTGNPCVTTLTDQDGIATAQFSAGPDKGVSSIRATVVSSRKDHWDGDIEVYKAPGFLRPRNIAILAAAAAGGITVCILKCGPNGANGPLHQVPPPRIP